MYFYFFSHDGNVLAVSLPVKRNKYKKYAADDHIGNKMQIPC